MVILSGNFVDAVIIAIIEIPIECCQKGNSESDSFFFFFFFDFQSIESNSKKKMQQKCEYGGHIELWDNICIILVIGMPCFSRQFVISIDIDIFN